MCFKLAFWTGRDGTRMDRLFRRSGLYRAKWDQQHYGDGRTYGRGAIDKAIADVVEVYGRVPAPFGSVGSSSVRMASASAASHSSSDRGASPYDRLQPRWLNEAAAVGPRD